MCALVVQKLGSSKVQKLKNRVFIFAMFISVSSNFMSQAVGQRIRNWVGTAFGDPEELYSHYSEANLAILLPHNVKFFIGQLEECPDTGRIHLQFLLCMNNAKTLSALKHCLLDKSVHLEPCRDLVAARAYCCKPESRYAAGFEFGHFPTPGERTDWKDISTRFQENKSSVKDVALEFPGQYVRYHKGIEKLHRLLSTVPSAQERKIESVTCYWGPPGTGKSTLVKRLAGIGAYHKRCGKWWPMYNGETVVILDEFDKWAKDVEADALTWFDGGAIFVRDDSYAHVALTATTFYITANQNPKYWMSSAMRSRCKIIHCHGNDKRRNNEELHDLDMDNHPLLMPPAVGAGAGGAGAAGAAAPAPMVDDVDP